MPYTCMVHKPTPMRTWYTNHAGQVSGSGDLASSGSGPLPLPQENGNVPGAAEPASSSEQNIAGGPRSGDGRSVLPQSPSLARLNAAASVGSLAGVHRVSSTGSSLAARILHSASPRPPEDPQFDAATVSELLQMMSTPDSEPSRFTAEEILSSEALAAAARREYEALNAPSPSLPPGVQVGLHLGEEGGEHVVCCGGTGRDMHPGLLRQACIKSEMHASRLTATSELLRQRFALESIDADVEEESKVNCEVAQLVLQRMREGHASLESLVRVGKLGRRQGTSRDA
eukprot:350388-Chlamydomonas_euryale.AAC.2